MFANRFSAFIDACTLAGVLRRNLLLTLAEAEFFRVQWSETVLGETERAIEKMLLARGDLKAAERASKAIRNMVTAFDEAMVTEFEQFLCLCPDMPDLGDQHVVAAAIKAQSSIIVTENIKHFPEGLVSSLGIEVRTSDAFISDTIALDEGKAVSAIRNMRIRFRNPELSADALLFRMEAQGLTETADLLSSHIQSL